MTPERYEQVCQICYDALELEASQRADFLDRACASDESLRREVEAMLANEGRAESFLDAPAFEIAAGQAAEGLGAEKTTLPFDDRRSNDTNTSPPETRVEPFAPGMILDGRYVIEKELDQGGIGVIYLSQDRKLRNRVVIKTLIEQSRAKSSANGLKRSSDKR